MVRARELAFTKIFFLLAQASVHGPAVLRRDVLVQSSPYNNDGACSFEARPTNPGAMRLHKNETAATQCNRTVRE